MNTSRHYMTDRALAYIRAGKKEGYSPRLVSRALGIYEATARRILATLVEEGSITLIQTDPYPLYVAVKSEESVGEA